MRMTNYMFAIENGLKYHSQLVIIKILLNSQLDGTPISSPKKKKKTGTFIKQKSA